MLTGGHPLPDDEAPGPLPGRARLVPVGEQRVVVTARAVLAWIADGPDSQVNTWLDRAVLPEPAVAGGVQLPDGPRHGAPPARPGGAVSRQRLPAPHGTTRSRRAAGRLSGGARGQGLSGKVTRARSAAPWPWGMRGSADGARGRVLPRRDDESALRVGPGRSHGFPAVPCDGIHPDDAVLTWEARLTGAESVLRDVVPMANDGFTVFAVPEPLCTALATAEGDRLRAAARAWAEGACEPGDEISPDDAVDLLERVSALAGRRAEQHLGLYRWYFAP